MSERLRALARGPMAVVVLGLVLLAVLAPRFLGGGGDAPSSEPLPLTDPLTDPSTMPGLGLDPAGQVPGTAGDPGTTTTTTTTLPPVERRNPFLPPVG